MGILSTLRTNTRLFPRFAALVFVTYAVVGLALALTLGVRMAVTLLTICVVIDIITVMAIRTNPGLFYRCQQAADLIVNYPRSTEGEPDGEIDENEGYEEDYEEEIEEDEEEVEDENSQEEGQEPRQ